MKVLHIISGGDSGGAKTHMFAMLDRMRLYADVTVLCLMRGEFYEEILSRPVRTLLFEQKRRADLSVCGRVVELVKNEGFDIVNAHGARANFIAAIVKKRLCVPVVTTIHSDPRLDFDDPYKKIVFGGLNALALRRIDYRIAVSDAFRDMMISRGFSPNNTAVVYNGLEFGGAGPTMTRAEFMKKYGVPDEEGAVYVGIVARLDHVKGVDVFLRAAAKVLEKRQNVRFAVIGSGNERAALDALCRELGITDRVHFLGFVREVYDFYAMIDINVMSSRSESFPYALLEGANAAKPTVCSAVGGIPKLIVDGETGFLFPSEDHGALAEKLIAMIDDKALRDRLGAELRRRASEKFSNDALARAYIANYERFIKYYKSPKRNDIVLAGYYGYGNAGDELLLHSIVDALRRRDGDVRITVLSAKPKETRLAVGADSVRRFDPTAIWRLYGRSSLLVLGGGNLAQNVTSRKSLEYYMTLVDIAKKRGMRAAMLANGIGPLTSDAAEKRAAKSLRRLDLATLRDRDSFDCFARLAPDVPRMLCADALFLTEPAAAKRKCGFVVSVRPWERVKPDFVDEVAEACSRFCRTYGKSGVILAMQPEIDGGICADVARRARERGADVEAAIPATPDDARSIIAGADFALGMRLHCLICAAVSGVRCAGIAYDPKVSAFAEAVGAPCVDIADVTADSVEAAVADAMAKEPPDAASMRKSVSDAADAVLMLLKK